MKLTAAFLTAALLLAAPAWAQATAASTGPKLETDEQKTLYVVGVSLSSRVAVFNLTSAELECVKAGLEDGVLGRDKKVDVQVYGPKIGELAQSRAAAVATAEKAAGQAFAEKAAAEAGAVKKPSGLVYKEIKPGTGESPTATDKVKVHYRGTLIDGKTEFDSSYKTNKPVEFEVRQVIPCWIEGVQLMKVGGTSKLICPSDIAYGDQGRPGAGIKPGATLVFDVELLEIVKPAAAAPEVAKPETAKPPAAKPAGAK